MKSFLDVGMNSRKFCIKKLFGLPLSFEYISMRQIEIAKKKKSNVLCVINYVKGKGKQVHYYINLNK